MLLVSKSKSYDKSFKGDFNLNSNNEISTLKRLMEIPSSPYYEAALSDYIQSYLDSLQLKFKTDQFGNIICRYTNGNIKNTSPVALIAHMDHPGIELIEQLNGLKNSIEAPKFCIASIVFITSSLFKRPLILLFPIAIEDKITNLYYSI